MAHADRSEKQYTAGEDILTLLDKIDVKSSEMKEGMSTNELTQIC